jgi:serine/threonine protein phosphatase PrpC
VCWAVTANAHATGHSCGALASRIQLDGAKEIKCRAKSNGTQEQHAHASQRKEREGKIEELIRTRARMKTEDDSQGGQGSAARVVMLYTAVTLDVSTVGALVLPLGDMKFVMFWKSSMARASPEGDNRLLTPGMGMLNMDGE